MAVSNNSTYRERSIESVRLLRQESHCGLFQNKIGCSFSNCGLQKKKNVFCFGFINVKFPFYTIFSSFLSSVLMDTSSTSSMSLIYIKRGCNLGMSPGVALLHSLKRVQSSTTAC